MNIIYNKSSKCLYIYNSIIYSKGSYIIIRIYKYP